jgi:diguanylate cyclase (GGDEF)-like protein
MGSLQSRELEQWLRDHLDRADLEEAIQSLSAGFVYKIASLERRLADKEPDPKTRLINFPRFVEQLEKFLAIEQRSRWCAIGLAGIAIADSANRTNGHAAFDRVIGRVARLLQQQVRADDLMSRTPHQAFCFLIPRLSGQERAFAVGERFRNAVERYDWTLEDRQLPERPARLDVGVVSLRLGRAAERRFIARRLAADLITRAGELLDRARTDPMSRTRFARMRVRKGEVVPIS